MISHSKAKKLSVIAFFATISIWLAWISHYLSIPFVPMLKIDISNVPIFVATLLFGAPYGYIILLVVTTLRTLFFSVAGWPGFLMRMIDIIPIFFIGIYHNCNKNLVFLCIFALLFSIVVKIPVSYLFWTKFFSMSPDFINSIMFPIVVPYNIIKLLLNMILAFLSLNKVKKYIS